MSATASGAAEFVPPRSDLPALRAAAAECRGCELYGPATQTVFGEGDVDARVVLVGEQPGDREDRQGRPFVGPAGRVLDDGLADAGIDRTRTYLTNVVKHFRFTVPERGKRRLHKTPARSHILACRPWLRAELALLDPDVLVCLGATAAKAVFGPSFRLTDRRGTRVPPSDFEAGVIEDIEARPNAVATIHPSAVLRADRDDRDDVYAGLVADLRVASELLV